MNHNFRKEQGLKTHAFNQPLHYSYLHKLTFPLSFSFFPHVDFAVSCGNCSAAKYPPSCCRKTFITPRAYLKPFLSTRQSKYSSVRAVFSRHRIFRHVMWRKSGNKPLRRKMATMACGHKKNKFITLNYYHPVIFISDDDRRDPSAICEQSLLDIIVIIGKSYHFPIDQYGNRFRMCD